MKIRRDFVTNSSSTCYIFDKRKLTGEEIETIRKAGEGLRPPRVFGLGRSSTYAEGHEAIGHIHSMLGFELEHGGTATYHQDDLRQAIDIGEDNVILARHSDEGMGGDFAVPERIDGKAVYTFEYH